MRACYVLKCLVHYMILRLLIKLVTASTTTEATQWTPEIAVSQEHIFQLSAQECNVSAFRYVQHWISPTPISHTGLIQKSYEKASCPLVMTLDARSLEQVQRKSRLSLNVSMQVRQNAGPRRDCSCAFKVRIQGRKPYFSFSETGAAM